MLVTLNHFHILGFVAIYFMLALPMMAWVLHRDLTDLAEVVARSQDTFVVEPHPFPFPAPMTRLHPLED